MGDLVQPKPDQFTAQQIMDDPVLRYFHFAHLPAGLREISEPFCALAGAIIATLPRNAERSTALRKLLEAKDCAVRANVSTPTGRKETFYDRLLAESKELEERYEKLGMFIESDPFDALPADDKRDLLFQREAMQSYKSILGRRIARLANANEFPVDGEIKTTGGNHSEEPVPFKEN